MTNLEILLIVNNLYNLLLKSRLLIELFKLNKELNINQMRQLDYMIIEKKRMRLHIKSKLNNNKKHSYSLN